MTYLWQDKQARAQKRTEAAQNDAKQALRDANTEKQEAGTQLEASTGVWVETDSSGEALDTEDAELGEGALLDAVREGAAVARGHRKQG